MTKEKPGPWHFCLAPMMARTDRHFRMLVRLIAPRMRLYTEMIVANAIIHGNRTQLLGFDTREVPLALQIAAAHPDEAAQAARIGADAGYGEINLNAGCPSPRTCSGRFGASMMREPDRIAACIASMRQAQDRPVTVKCRLGVDSQDPDVALWAVARSAQAEGAAALIVHARKAWLDGLDPQANRTVPPLNHDKVRALKRDFPDLPIILNGGIAEVAQLARSIAGCDGLMIGRAAYRSPWILANMEAVLFPAGIVRRDKAWRDEILGAYTEYALGAIGDGARPLALLRHLMPLCIGLPGARAIRRQIGAARTLSSARAAFAVARDHLTRYRFLSHNHHQGL